MIATPPVVRRTPELLRRCVYEIVRGMKTSTTINAVALMAYILLERLRTLGLVGTLLVAVAGPHDGSNGKGRRNVQKFD